MCVRVDTYACASVSECVQAFVYTRVLYLVVSVYVCDLAQGMKYESSENSSKEELATYLLRVKDEEQADEFVAMVQKYK